MAIELETSKAKEVPLVEAARRGDVKAFSALVGLYQERAVRTAYSVIGNWEDARDIAQEAFVKAYENLTTFKAESRFFTWLYRILINLCKDFLRKKKVRGFVLLCLGRQEEDGQDPVSTVTSTAKDAAGQMINTELGSKIHDALDKLPFQQRTAFTLRYLEGLSINEVSQSMALSEGAVKAHIWQAIQKMQKSLGGYLSMEVI